MWLSKVESVECLNFPSAPPHVTFNTNDAAFFWSQEQFTMLLRCKCLIPQTLGHMNISLFCKRMLVSIGHDTGKNPQEMHMGACSYVRCQ